jgi:hypothetical protein
MYIIPVLYTLIVLHTIDGREIDINAAEITSLREAGPDDAKDKIFPKGLRCMINMSDGKFANVIETCAEVRKLIEKHR